MESIYLTLPSLAFGDPRVIAKVAYFVHDLTDPAVHRRIRMLCAGGAAVTPIGFRRSAEPSLFVEGIPAVDLGRSIEGKLSRRAISVIRALAKLEAIAKYVAEADVIIARNLEMLAVATKARERYAPKAKLVYECLDIHRTLTSNSLGSHVLRLCESRLWRNVDLLLTSSPAFVRNYFSPRGLSAPIRLVENKLLSLDEYPIVGARPPGPPWRIGWFGMIRCCKSLDILCSLAKTSQGAVEVIIRGRPSPAVFTNLDDAISAQPNVLYAGSYQAADLPEIYRDVHFVWAIDYYERGQNSTWLLPNRIYEGNAYGGVPIALAEVETGTWLAERSAGVVLSEPLQEQLVDFFTSLDQCAYEKLAQAVTSLPRAALVSDRADCRDLVQSLCHLPRQN
jgi:succinoglycan biosynthesis protein ExoL